MQKLRDGKHIHLTSDMLKTLAQNRIITILDFLQEDTNKLATLTKLSFCQVLDTRNDILLKYASPLISGTTLLTNSFTKKKFLSSGIQSLDSIIDGGIPIGFITEVCGLADSGKTQLCLQLALNAVKNTADDTVLYVDTKGDFSATRIQKILDAYGYSYKEMAQIMVKIRVVQVWTMDEILALFKSIKDKGTVINNLKLIVIDSLPCLMFQFLGDENKLGLTFLNTLVNFSRYLCKQMDIAIVCVNIQTRWIDQDTVNVEDDGELSTISKECTEQRNRCLGKYWQQIPALVLILEKTQDNGTQTIQVNVTVAKSFTSGPSQKCVLNINNLGVT